MKLISLAVATIYFLAGPVSALAEEQAGTEAPLTAVVSDAEASVMANPGMSQPMTCMGMKHGGCQHGKCQGGMKHGGGQYGKGQGGMKHGGGRHGKGSHEKDRQVVQRLDMIEARMAKIEAMLEILMRR